MKTIYGAEAVKSRVANILSECLLLNRILPPFQRPYPGQRNRPAVDEVSKQGYADFPWLVGVKAM